MGYGKSGISKNSPTLQLTIIMPCGKCKVEMDGTCEYGAQDRKAEPFKNPAFITALNSFIV